MFVFLKPVAKTYTCTYTHTNTLILHFSMFPQFTAYFTVYTDKGTVTTLLIFLTGNRWFHISQRPPHLSLVSAGGASVWACDGNGKIYWFCKCIFQFYVKWALTSFNTFNKLYYLERLNLLNWST